ncbi:hypothetical protein DSO57_1030622 [Entomophthora muscae]|uniref:Uncharacterized protein n=1 Tax=Entomophthora muscae TaxID=34485 RepID=A0ACC2UKR5_9FUNG|nr:hypothetical protein DSO57_1030622 [Entomophthora muscae]
MSRINTDVVEFVEPGSRNQTPTLDPLGPLGLGTEGPPTRIFSGIEPPQAEAKNVGPCSETGQTKEIIAPNGRPITAPNRGTEAATISFMNLKSTPVANQEPSSGRGIGPRPVPMTTTLKQVNQNPRDKCHFSAFEPEHPVPPGLPFPMP